jgi:hypothetical protein
MKIFISLLLLLAITLFSYGQKQFVGVAKYKMAVVGGPDEDSLAIVFDKNRILITLYTPSHENPKKIHQIIIINDFSKNKQYTLDNVAKTYKIDTLINAIGYGFIDTKKIILVKGAVCFHYKADSSQIDKTNMLRGDCLVAIDYMNESIKNFWFMGFQPIIVDSKIVMDFIVTEPDGSKPRVYISEIVAKQSVDEYFDLSNYKELK